MMRRFRFSRLYIPTGEISEGEMDALSFAQLCESLNSYNESAPTRHLWKYWTTDHTGRII